MIKMLPMSLVIYNEKLDIRRGNVTDLAEDIKKNGLINPITVIEENGEYKVLAGYRRYKAHLLNGEKHILANIVEGTLNNENS